MRCAQVARCFRDEDLRADRQPEFTQLDLEVSFMDAQAIQDLMEGLIVKVFREVAGVELQTPFPRMTYQEAMERCVVGRQGLCGVGTSPTEWKAGPGVESPAAC